MNDLRHWMRLCEMQELSNAVIEQAAKRLAHDIDWGGGGGETVMHMMGHDPNDGEGWPDTNSPEFQADLLEWARDRVSEAYYRVVRPFRGDTIHVYRMITAPPDWQPDPNRHPGDYWAWGEDCAEAHWGSWGDSDVEWMLEADVHSDQINWVETLAANGDPSYEDECEINTVHGAPIKLTGYKKVK